MRSEADTVEEYLREIPADRRPHIEAVRAVIKKHLPKGYEEAMRWGMISYEIPLSVYPSTYNKQPLAYAALAAQKNFNTVYLMTAGNKTVEQKLRVGSKKAGKKLDLGKSCIHFKSADDLPLDVIGEIVASTPPKDWIAIVEARVPAKRPRRT
jgi:hypothetical protein